MKQFITLSIAALVFAIGAAVAQLRSDDNGSSQQHHHQH
jgi:hypothetical protein